MLNWLNLEEKKRFNSGCLKNIACKSSSNWFRMAFSLIATMECLG